MAVDSLQVDAAVLDSLPHQSMHYRRADDNYVGSSSIGGIRPKPGIAKGNVCRLRDHVVAEIAGGILHAARAPTAIAAVPPIHTEAVSVLRSDEPREGKWEVRTCRTRWEP